MKRALIVFATLLILSSAAFADDAGEASKSLSVRTFTFKYKDASKAGEIIKALLSVEGSMSIQPSSNALVITDRPENLKSIAKALSQFDSPPQAFRLMVRIVGATRVEGTPPKPPDELKDLAPTLRMFRYNAFEPLGNADVAGREGDPGIANLPTGYRADFKFGEYDPASDSIKVTDLRLSKLQNDQLTQLLKTTLNLRIGETYVFTVAKGPQSQRALMIVLVANK